MVNLKQQVEQLIADATEYNYQALEEMVSYEISQILDYYMPTLIQTYNNYIAYETDNYSYKMDQVDIDLLVEYITDNIDNLMKRFSGYYCSKNEMTLAHSEELEIPLPESWKLTPYKKAVINRYTDLYIPDRSNDFGYCADDTGISIQLDIDTLRSIGIKF